MASFPSGCTMVFGGSGGIGQGIVRTFAEQGSDVAIVYRSRREPAEDVASQARAAGRKASIHAADVTDPTSIQSAVDAAIAEHGRIHSVVWAAGPLVNQRSPPLAMTSQMRSEKIKAPSGI